MNKFPNRIFDFQAGKEHSKCQTFTRRTGTVQHSIG